MTNLPILKESNQQLHTNEDAGSSNLLPEQQNTFIYFASNPLPSKNWKIPKIDDKFERASVAESVLEALERREKELIEMENQQIKSNRSVLNYLPEFYQQFLEKPVCDINEYIYCFIYKTNLVWNWGNCGLSI